VTVNDAISRLNLTIDPDSPLSAFTTQAEQQADTIATQILYDSRFDPRLIPTAFQRLINQRDLSRDFVANHPTPANRTVAIRQELQRRGPLPASWRGSSTGFQTAQQLLRDESTIGLAGRSGGLAWVEQGRSGPAAVLTVTVAAFYRFRKTRLCEPITAPL
jgi:predicted Zn-dependent protease